MTEVQAAVEPAATPGLAWRLVNVVHGVLGGFLGFVDLFVVWWIVSLAIGVGVLYNRRIGPIATSLLTVYAAVAVAVAVFL